MKRIEGAHKRMLRLLQNRGGEGTAFVLSAWTKRGERARKWGVESAARWGFLNRWVDEKKKRRFPRWAGKANRGLPKRFFFEFGRAGGGKKNGWKAAGYWKIFTSFGPILQDVGLHQWNKNLKWDTRNADRGAGGAGGSRSVVLWPQRWWTGGETKFRIGGGDGSSGRMKCPQKKRNIRTDRNHATRAVSGAWF